MTDNETKSTPETESTSETVTTEVATEETEHDHHHHEGEESEEPFLFVEEPTFEMDYKGDCAYEVKVVIPSSNEEKQSSELFDELKHEAIVPGFRKGKAPIKLIQKKFEKYVRNEVESKLISEAFRKLVKDHELRPLKEPEIEGIDKLHDRQSGEPICVTLKFEVAPKVTLGKYRGIELKRQVQPIPDDAVDQAIEALRNRFAVYETLKEGTAQDGDQVIIDFRGTVDGQEFRGGTAKNYPYILGTKKFFAEFERALQGVSVGAELECDVEMPEDYFNEELRGKTAHFQITVKEIRRKQVPELNDEFAKLAGHESVEALRKVTSERLQQEQQEAAKALLEAEALKRVIEDSTFELPKSWVESQTESIFENRVRELLAQRVPMDRIREMEDQLKNEARETAVDEIKRLVTLLEIADAEGLQVTDEDVEGELEATASRTGLDMETLAKFLGESEDRRNSYVSRLLRAKAIKLILDNAKVVDEEISK